MTAIRAAVRERWGEVAAFALLTAVGAAVVVSAFSYGVLDDGGRVGPGFMPLVLGGLLFVLGGVQLVSRLRAPVSSAVSLPSGETDGPAGQRDDDGVDSLGRTQAYRVRQLWTVVAAIFVGILLVPFLGFLIAFGALVLFISIVVERRPWLGALVITAVAVAVVYGVFGVFLDVPLPTGLIDLTPGS